MAKKKKIGTKEIKSYIESPFYCPYCNSDKIEKGEVKNGMEIFIKVSCPDCKKEWVEIYKLDELAL